MCLYEKVLHAVDGYCSIQISGCNSDIIDSFIRFAITHLHIPLQYMTIYRLLHSFSPTNIVLLWLCVNVCQSIRNLFFFSSYTHSLIVWIILPTIWCSYGCMQKTKKNIFKLETHLMRALACLAKSRERERKKRCCKRKYKLSTTWNSLLLSVPRLSYTIKVKWVYLQTDTRTRTQCYWNCVIDVIPHYTYIEYNICQSLYHLHFNLLLSL